MSLPDFIFVGAAKTASTWTYECLKEHPEIFMPEDDRISFFSLRNHRDLSEYEKIFEEATEPFLGEQSNDYIHSCNCPTNIHENLEEVKLIFSLRNPVDRAYSGYWHGYSRGKVESKFEKVFTEPSMYHSFILPGFYHRHIQRYMEYFDEDQIKIVFFEDLKEDDESFIQDIYEFIGTDSSYEPSKLRKKVNKAAENQNNLYGRLKALGRENLPGPVKSSLRPAKNLLDTVFSEKSNYQKNMNEEMRQELEKVYREDVRKLQEYTGRDLSHWFEYESLED